MRTTENQSLVSLLFEDKGQYTLECSHRTENRSQPHRQALTQARGMLPWSGSSPALFLTKKVVSTKEERAAKYFNAHRNEALLVMLNEIIQTQRYHCCCFYFCPYLCFCSLLLCDFARKNMGKCGVFLLLPRWKGVGPPSSQDSHVSSECSIFSPCLPFPKVL